MTHQARAVTAALNAFVEKAVKKITLDVTANLIETTPVDTGWARANWVPSIGVAATQNLRGTEVTSQQVAAAGATQRSGQAEVLGYALNRGKVFVTNDVPYINRLNDGSSDQAPSGFVQRSIAKAVTQGIRGF